MAAVVSASASSRSAVAFAHCARWAKVVLWR